MDVDVIDLDDIDLPVRLPRHSSPTLNEYLSRLDRADAFVVVTPEYNHRYPAGLKQAIDLAHAEWRAKPVAFVSYGGMAGGLRAVEQLRQVFAELYTVTVRDTVIFHNVWPLVDEATGAPHDPDGCNAAAAGMLDQLAWWASALRTARHRTTTPAHNREAFRRLYEDAVSTGELDVIDEVVRPDVVHHTRYAAQEPGARGLKDTAAMLRRTYDEFKMMAHGASARSTCSARRDMEAVGIDRRHRPMGAAGERPVGTTP